MKYALLFVLFLSACTTEIVEDKQDIAPLNLKVDYKGVFTNTYGLDMDFENTNLPYWWSEKYIDSLGIKHIEIKEFLAEDFEKGVDYTVALPKRRVRFNFNREGGLRSMHKQEFYDDILISSKEFKMGKTDPCGRVEVRQKVFSKYKKRHFYDPLLENITDAYLEPMDDIDSTYIYKGRKSEVLCVNGSMQQLNYLRDSLNKSVYSVTGSLKSPQMLCCYGVEASGDTLQRNIYSNSGVLLFHKSNEGEIEHKKSFTYANNLLVEIKDSLFIAYDFVSEESYLFFYDSLGLPSQIQRKETLENSVSQLNAVYILTFNK
ncbi:hypothetical protein [Lishizhenia sp.]|uniref:hypothetical protein n=1 Tax=Lishizhenia sp. TaxID=2497594 RepID=UPI00299E6BC5|nr:hypothetical protein [Lishizhenia sp.]MDX1446721.1 hypothetical protein [Lishizhenia sp.]